MGVWIETWTPSLRDLTVTVTPCMGVWIETLSPLGGAWRTAVTPCMGVWIETEQTKKVAARLSSHPVWVCGLKHQRLGHKRAGNSHTLYGCVDWNFRNTGKDLAQSCHTLYGCVDWNIDKYKTQPWQLVTPCMGVWIETLNVTNLVRLHTSHPVWVCGLKQRTGESVDSKLQSHPVWVCGLKHFILINNSLWMRHTLYGCVDWNTVSWMVIFIVLVTPCMGVWIETLQYNYYARNPKVTPCMGVWIETLSSMGWWREILVTPCMGVWIETLQTPSELKEFAVTPCMGVWIETTSITNIQQDIKSHPVWVCGLKLSINIKSNGSCCHTLYGCVDWNTFNL